MGLKDIKLRDDSVIEDIEIEEPFTIISKLEEKVKKLQTELTEANQKLFEYGMCLLSSDEVEALKERNSLLESEKEDLQTQLINIESEKNSLLVTIAEKDSEISSLKEELSKRKKSGRPAKYDIYIDKVQSLYSELQSVSRVVNALHSEGIEISVAQVKRMIKKSVA